MRAESGHTILLVDDEENILRSLKRQLVDTQYRLLTAGSAAQGLEVLAAQDIAVVISDQRMPGMSGTEFLTTVREQYPDTIRILLTAYSDMQDTIDAINKGGIYKFIHKPWEEQELKQAISQAVEQYAAARENRLLKNEALSLRGQSQPKCSAGG
jgi:DNA-binding NtrC family response regulator